MKGSGEQPSSRWDVRRITESPVLQRRSTSGSDSLLRLTAALLVAAFAIHGIDHLRRGLDFEPMPILVIGTAQTLLVVLAVVLVAIRSRWAPVVAVAVGMVNATGFTLERLPDWFGPFSDSFAGASPHRHVTAYSWVFAILDILAAIAFAVAGARVLRSRNPF
jgi:cyanate permease